MKKSPLAFPALVASMLAIAGCGKTPGVPAGALAAPAPSDATIAFMPRPAVAPARHLQAYSSMDDNIMAYLAHDEARTASSTRIAAAGGATLCVAGWASYNEFQRWKAAGGPDAVATHYDDWGYDVAQQVLPDGSYRAHGVNRANGSTFDDVYGPDPNWPGRLRAVRGMQLPNPAGGAPLQEESESDYFHVGDAHGYYFCSWRVGANAAHVGDAGW